MPALSNVKWEKFALGVAQGTLSAARAYIAAGYAAEGHSAEANAARLLKKAEVAARVAELQATKAERVQDQEALTRLWVLDRLMRNARIALGEETVKIKVRPKAAPETVIELEVTDREAGAANKALELLGREVGLFVEKTESTVTHKHEDRVARRAEVIARRRQEQGDGSSAPVH